MKSECVGCELEFPSVRAFDAHRVGKQGVNDGPERRRCLTIPEMAAKGWRQNARGWWANGRPMPSALRTDQKRDHVRFPRVLSLRAVFEYLSRAYPAAPQPKRIEEGETFLQELGLSCVWTGKEFGLECCSCGMVYVRSGTAGNHKCSEPLGATSFERAKSTHQALEGSSVPEGVSWDLPEAETSFEHVTGATDGQRSSERELIVEDVDLPIEVVGLQRAGRFE